MRRILIGILAAMLLGSALAQAGDEPGAVLDPVALPTRTLTCQVAAPAWAGLCYIETTIATLGPVEVLIGLEARAALSPDPNASVAGYLTLAWWEAWGGVWLDVRMPEIIPPIGVSDWLRVGFTTRF